MFENLRHGSKKYRKKYGSKSNRGQIKGRIDIDERPAVVDDRTRLGDWEVDTVIGKNHQGVLVTLVERTTRFTLVKKVKNKTARAVTRAIISLLKPYKADVYTITADNGREFAWHKKITKELDVSFFFAKPYHSWERGTNENTNGLLRQYFPKHLPFANATTKWVKFAMNALNDRCVKKRKASQMS